MKFPECSFGTVSYCSHKKYKMEERYNNAWYPVRPTVRYGPFSYKAKRAPRSRTTGYRPVDKRMKPSLAARKVLLGIKLTPTLSRYRANVLRGDIRMKEVEILVNHFARKNGQQPIIALKMIMNHHRK